MNDVRDIYEELDYLGSGHYGNVYKVQNKSVNRTEALKIIEISKSTSSNSELIKEAQKQYDVKCDNVVTLYNAFTQHNKLYISMEYLNGGTLEKASTEKYLSVREIIKYLSDSLHGLKRIHNSGYIHRDIKPNNILLNEYCAKLSDFGLSDKMNSNKKLESGYGYSIHRAPEVLIIGQYYIQSDIYAMGVTAFRLFNGSDFINFYKNNTKQMNEDIIAGTFPLREEDSYRWDVPKKLIKVINQAMEVKIENRFQNAHKFRAALNSIDLPIDWICKENKSFKKIWEGTCSQYKYKIEVNRHLITKRFDIIVYKGKSKLQRKNSYCLESISEKDLSKKVRSILSNPIK